MGRGGSWPFNISTLLCGLTYPEGVGSIRNVANETNNILRGGKHNNFPVRAKTTLKFVIQSPMSKVQLSQLGLWTLDVIGLEGQ